MKLFKKRRKLNNKGLSLVELVCAVAIFGLATTAIGGAMVVSAQNYSRGTYELDVQQEAQTTTNLIGDLLYDATGASFDSTAANPVLKIQGENIEYHITFDKTNKKLEYAEYVTGVATPATGTLAENVTDFSANLDAEGNNFKADKNVEIKLEIEKNGRTYEADYNTTARNGAAESVGVAETAEIIIETPIVLEPGQTYNLPFEVVGSITNKSISIASGTGITAVQSGTNISVTASSTASGTTSFTVSTNEPQKDGDGNPIIGTHLATKTVTVNIRRVNDVTSPQDADDDGYADSNALKSGTNYKNGAEYHVDFSFVGDYLDKVYGKAYDTNYVNPRQVDISWTMTGMEAGFDADDYVSAVQIVGLDNPYINFKLIKDLPNNSEITITATAKHPAGTNKTTNPYATVVDVVKIKYETTLYGSSDLRRGSDGIGILVDNATLDTIRTTVAANNAGVDWNWFRHLLTVYEVDASGNKVEIPDFPTYIFGSGSTIQVDNDDSLRLVPNKEYIYRVELMFYKDSACTQPLWTISPYSAEFPLDAVALTYDYQVDENRGTALNPYTMTAGLEDYSIDVDVRGLDMSTKQSSLKFYVEKYVDGVGWTTASNYDVRSMTGTKNTGICTTFFKFGESGRYRAKAYLGDYQYYSYDGSTSLTYTGDLFDESDDTGIFYINVN